MSLVNGGADGGGSTNGRARPIRGRVRIGDAWLAYERVGRGRPVVLVPETVSDRRMWQRQVPALAAHYEVIRYDLRGYGRSSLGHQGVRRAEDLAGLLDSLHVEQAALLAFRGSAEIALELALDQPERVQALVLALPVLSNLVAELYRTGRRQPLEHGPRQRLELSRAEERALAAAVRRAAVIRLENWLLEYFRAWPERPYLRYRSARASVLTLDRLREVKAPTLLVRGEWSGSMSEQEVGFLRESLPLGEVVTVPQAFLIPPTEAPAAFNRVVLDFLAARYPPDAAGTDG